MLRVLLIALAGLPLCRAQSYTATVTSYGPTSTSCSEAQPLGVVTVPMGPGCHLRQDQNGGDMVLRVTSLTGDAAVCSTSMRVELWMGQICGTGGGSNDHLDATVTAGQCHAAKIVVTCQVAAPTTTVATTTTTTAAGNLDGLGSTGDTTLTESASDAPTGSAAGTRAGVVVLGTAAVLAMWL